MIQGSRDTTVWIGEECKETKNYYSSWTYPLHNKTVDDVVLLIQSTIEFVRALVKVNSSC